MINIEEYLADDLIIYNPTLGVRDFVTIAEIKSNNNSTLFWLDEPYKFVGPLLLDEIVQKGQIYFEACIIMTKENWSKRREELQQESYKKQQKAHYEFQEKLKRKNYQKQNSPSYTKLDEQKYREILSLPTSGNLQISQIKTAYRKLAKTEHPDVGGSDERFVLILEAKEILLQTLA